MASRLTIKGQLISDFLETKIQHTTYALYDTPLLNRPRIQIAGTSLVVSQPWCLAPASFGGIREEK